MDYGADAADQKLIRTPLLITAAVGIAATVIATLVAGSKGAIAGALGTVVVLAFFGLGQYVVARVLRNNPAIAMNMAFVRSFGPVLRCGSSCGRRFFTWSRAPDRASGLLSLRRAMNRSSPRQPWRFALARHTTTARLLRDGE